MSIADRHMSVQIRCKARRHRWHLRQPWHRVKRGEASRITGLPVRTAQRVLNDRVGEGLLASATPKGQYRCAFRLIP
jgi:Fic family protein